MNGKEENRAPRRGYNAFSRSGWYLHTTRKGEGEKDTLLFQSTTIDTISMNRDQLLIYLEVIPSNGLINMP